jgi:glutathione S-transferase
MACARSATTAGFQEVTAMKLFITPNSPYARRARIVARERGLSALVEEVTVTLRSPANLVLESSPLGRVPTLVVGPDLVLTESSTICEYLDSIADGTDGERLTPTDPAERLRALAADGRAVGLLDCASTWVRELRRDVKERSPGVIALEQARAARCLDALESGVMGLGPSSRLSMAQITIVCTLGLLDAFIPHSAWRQGRPTLEGWFAELSRRPSIEATAPRT